MQAKSIPTRYRGILFRSKLEADWALAFDRMGVEWQYEKEGLQLDELFYLPDFYLPRSGQYAEAKVEPTPTDVRKWMSLVRHVGDRPFTNPETCPNVPLIVCRPGGEFFGYAQYRGTAFAEFVMDHAVPVMLFQCQCGGTWFGVQDLAWRCQCCGLYDGRRHVRDLWSSPVEGFPRPWSWAA